MKDKIFNTIKIAGAAIAAILLSGLMGLTHSVSAGIIAILTIQPTKKETIRTAGGRLAAFTIALCISYICFLLLGVSMPAFMLYLLIYIFVCQQFRWYSAITMNSVLISHFLTWGAMEPQMAINEMLLFVVGVGMGILANLHLHKNTDYIEELKENTDDRIRNILYRMSERIVNRDISDYNGECFVVLRDSIRRAGSVAEENFNNQLGSSDVYDREYIRMRDRQCHVLYEMYKSVRTLETTPITAAKISDFFREIAEAYHKDNTGKELLSRFYRLDEGMKDKPLPTGRKEFEDRAKLFCLLRYIEEFIKIKMEFMETYAGEKSDAS